MVSLDKTEREGGGGRGKAGGSLCSHWCSSSGICHVTPEGCKAKSGGSSGLMKD